MSDDPSAVAVRIGREHTHEGLRTTSVVTSGYGRGTEVVGGLGVLGPTRMDYPTTIATVRAVARYVSRVLDD
nr:HrcA family transcriptional regulator [Angustibacter aerolatus]